jgi:hypothetical protein
MNKTKSEQPPEPIRFASAVTIDGKYYPPGADVPYASESDVPETLKHLIARDESEIPPPVTRDIYGQQPGGAAAFEAGVVYQPLSGGQWVQRQARAALAISQEQIWCEEQAEIASKLSPELEEVLQDSHDKHIALTKAQLEASQRFTDAIYEDVERQAAEPQKFYVKRGAVFTDARKAKVKPAETVYARRASGEYECIGTADATGGLPDEEIFP